LARTASRRSKRGVAVAAPAPRVDPLAGWTAPSPPRRNALRNALVLSLGAHLALLAVRFVPPERTAEDRATPPLEVVLVNARTKSKPRRAEVLAQADLDGGGNTTADRRAKTSLPALTDSQVNDVSLSARRIAQLEEESRRLIAQLAAAPPVPTQPRAVRPQPERTDGRDTPDAERQRLEIARLEAEIARRWDAYQKLPKRKFIGARAEGVVYARYVDDWRTRVERIGTRNFPNEARTRGIYGTLLVTVSIRADGTLEKIEIDRSSGHPVLDAAAKRILELASPFAAFPPAIRRDYDILSITRTWTFTRAQELVSE
jgi:protein TonB